jgi:hypothetical protein
VYWPRQIIIVTTNGSNDKEIEVTVLHILAEEKEKEKEAIARN